MSRTRGARPRRLYGCPMRHRRLVVVSHAIERTHTAQGVRLATRCRPDRPIDPARWFFVSAGAFASLPCRNCLRTMPVELAASRRGLRLVDGGAR